MIALGACEFGWRPDLADHRDYSPEVDQAAGLLDRLKTHKRKTAKQPQRVDWREFNGPVEDQRDLPTGTAHACVGLVQHFERRTTGRLLQLSRLFVHTTACRMAGHAGSTGKAALSLRMVLKAAVRCGIPPEKYWPYEAAGLGREPDAFAFSFQRGFRTMRYVRLDDGRTSGPQVLDRVRSFLAAGFPLALGFPVCNSVSEEAEIPYPTATDSVLGGQAVVAVGYDDQLRIRSAKGALLIRNSWGTAWGDRGYGWLPYAYVTQRLATDFWTLMKPSWIRSGELQYPHQREATRSAVD